MDIGAVAVPMWQRNVARFFAAALLAVVWVEARPVAAAECDPNCDLDIQPRAYSDPRCVPRPVVPKNTSTPFPAFQSNGPHCDFRPKRRQAHNHAPSATAQPPSGAALRHAPGAGTNVPGHGANQSGTATGDPATAAGDPGRQPPRSVDRDVGFADAFGARADEFRASPRAGGVGAGGVGFGAGGVGAGGVGAGGAARSRP